MMPKGPAALQLGGGGEAGWPEGAHCLAISNSMLLYPCFHLVIIREHKFTSIIAYTYLANNVLVCVVHLFGNTENTTIWGYSGKFLFLCLRLCQPDDMLCHVLGVLVGSLSLLGLSYPVSLLQGLVGIESCTLLLYSFINLCITPPGFRSPLWFFKRPQTSVAASSRGPFSFEQTVSARFAVSAVTPALVAAAADAVVTFNLKAA